MFSLPCLHWLFQSQIIVQYVEKDMEITQSRTNFWYIGLEGKVEKQSTAEESAEGPKALLFYYFRVISESWNCARLSTVEWCVKYPSSIILRPWYPCWTGEEDDDDDDDDEDDEN